MDERKLTHKLRWLPIGDTLVIGEKEHTLAVVKSTASQMRKKGFFFKCSWDDQNKFTTIKKLESDAKIKSKGQN